MSRSNRPLTNYQLIGMQAALAGRQAWDAIWEKCWRVPPGKGCSRGRTASSSVNALIRRGLLARMGTYEATTRITPLGREKAVELGYAEIAERLKAGERCHAARSDGECIHPNCPQRRDGEPAKTGRHCPLDVSEDED